MTIDHGVVAEEMVVMCEEMTALVVVVLGINQSGLWTALVVLNGRNWNLLLLWTMAIGLLPGMPCLLEILLLNLCRLLIMGTAPLLGDRMSLHLLLDLEVPLLVDLTHGGGMIRHLPVSEEVVSGMIVFTEEIETVIGAVEEVGVGAFGSMNESSERAVSLTVGSVTER